jgi:hypothetical protein
LAVHKALIISNATHEQIPAGDSLDVGTGITSPNDILELGKAVLLKNLTSAERDALTGPTAGTWFYNSDLNRPQVRLGSNFATEMLDETTFKSQELVARLFQTSSGSTSDELAGGNFYDPARFTNSTGRSIFFEAVLVSSDGNPVRVKLRSVGAAAYVTNLDGNSNDYIETSSTTPIRVVSQNLLGAGADNFDENSTDVYEVYVVSTDAGTTATLYAARLINTNE